MIAAADKAELLCAGTMVEPVGPKERWSESWQRFIAATQHPERARLYLGASPDDSPHCKFQLLGRKA